MREGFVTWIEKNRVAVEGSSQTNHPQALDAFDVEGSRSSPAMVDATEQGAGESMKFDMAKAISWSTALDKTSEEICSPLEPAFAPRRVPLLHSVDDFLDCRYVAVAARAYAVAGAISVLLNCAVVAAFSCWIDDVTSRSR